MTATKTKPAEQKSAAWERWRAAAAAAWAADIAADELRRIAAAAWNDWKDANAAAAAAAAKDC